MAFIPDEAIDAMREVSNSAFRVYAYLCRRRNRQSGGCFPTLRRIAQDCGLCYSYASEIRKELILKGWIRLDPEGVIYPLKGFNSSENPKTISENPNDVSENPKPVSENPKRYIKELTSTFNQHIKPSKMAVAIPDDFEVSDRLLDWFRSKGYTFDCDTETEKFGNHYRAKGTKFKDWEAAWRNWMIKAEEITNGKNRGTATQRKTNAQRLADYKDYFERLESSDE